MTEEDILRMLDDNINIRAENTNIRAEITNIRAENIAANAIVLNKIASMEEKERKKRKLCVSTNFFLPHL